MKRIAATVSALLIAALPVLAQKTVTTRSGLERPVNEISVSYGTLSVPHIAYLFGGILGTAFTGGMAKVDRIATSGAIGVDYMNYLNSHVAVGGTLIDEYLTLAFDSYDGKDENGNVTYKDGDSQRNNLVTIMPAVKIPWFYREHVSMYTKAGVGICVNTSTGDTSFALQMSAVGIDFGGNSFRGFAEGGFGMQGLLIGGVRWMF